MTTNDPDGLEISTIVLRNTAFRLMSQGASEDDVMDFVQAVRDHLGQQVMDTARQNRLQKESPEIYRGALLAVDLTYFFPFILKPEPGEEVYEYIYCGAILSRPSYPFYCNRRLNHEGECSPDHDKD